MNRFRDWRTVAGVSTDRFFKTTLFRGDRLMVGLNCLEPGQVQAVHTHADQDKFYHVLEGVGEFTVGDATREAGVGTVVWAPAGEPHGVANQGEGRLALLVGIAPAPGAVRGP